MKTLVLSMISIAATVAAMTACTSESDPVDEIVNPKDEKVEIKLNAGVVGIDTKAAITQNEGISSFNNVQVPLFRMDGTTDPTWSSVSESVKTSINNSEVILDAAQQYYPASGNAYFIGYYSELTPSSSNKNIISFNNVDGTKDIICTDQTDAGSKVSPISNAKLVFNHMLSKVEIKIIGTAASISAFGNITKIELLEIPTSLDLTLNKKSSIAANNTPNAQSICLFEGSQAIPTTDAESVGAIPMIFNGGSSPYGTNDAPLKIKITTDKGETFDIQVKSITNGLENGKKHTITLTFKDKIGISSEITSWGISTNNGAEEVG